MITLKIPEQLQQQAEGLANKRSKNINLLLLGLLEEVLIQEEEHYPNGLLSLALEDVELATELAAWERVSDEALYLIEERIES